MICLKLCRLLELSRVILLHFKFCCDEPFGALRSVMARFLAFFTLFHLSITFFDRMFLLMDAKIVTNCISKSTLNCSMEAVLK